jgi:sugar transferase (PEP-CTERM/EpsH1 system associated)
LKILWLKTELLHPVDKGGKIRTYQMLKELKKDHQITYLTLDDGSSPASATEQALEYCQALIKVPHQTAPKFSLSFYGELFSNLFSRLPYAVKKYDSPAMRQILTEHIATQNFDVFVCDFLAPASNVPDRLQCPTVLFQHNVEAMIWQRHYQVQRNALKRAYLKQQWQKMFAFEKEMCGRFGAVASVSENDTRTMKQEYGVENVFEVPTGVDVDFFRPDQKVKPEANTLVFTGSMDWLPNEDAIRYFTEEILPLIKRQIPDVKLTVVGRDPYPGLIELSKRDPAIVVTGRVDDVRPYIDRAAAYVVPLRIGGGTRIKIYEAMAMEKPVISTSIGAEGLPLEDGKEIILADTASDFADSVIRVLRDESNDLARRAATTVRQKFAWKNAADQFASICERARQ